MRDKAAEELTNKKVLEALRGLPKVLPYVKRHELPWWAWLANSMPAAAAGAAGGAGADLMARYAAGQAGVPYTNMMNPIQAMGPAGSVPAWLSAMLLQPAMNAGQQVGACDMTRRHWWGQGIGAYR